MYFNTVSVEIRVEHSFGAYFQFPRLISDHGGGGDSRNMFASPYVVSPFGIIHVTII